MGTAYRFECSKCQYQADVSGGKDCGFQYAVETSVCADCRSLADVPICFAFELDLPERMPNDDPAIGACPECRGRKITPWAASQPCPKCGARMEKGNLQINWD